MENNVKESVSIKSKRYEKVPPEGGYGYVILFAVSVNYIATTGFATCFGMIFNDFFIEMEMGSTAVTLLAGINAMSVAVAGFLTGPLLKVLSMRKLALLASVFFNVGIFATVFVKSQVQFIVCQGLLQSFGLGILYNVSCTALNDYFLQKRLFAMSLTQTLAAAAAMVAPMVVSWTSAHYGFRGTLIMMSAVGAQTFVASGLLQPVAWHMKRVEVDHIPEKQLLLENVSGEKNNESMKTPVIKLTDPESVDDKKQKQSSRGNDILTFIKNFIDWPLFKKFVLTCGCLGAPVAIFADITFVFFLAQALYDFNWNEEGVAWAFSLVGFGDIATRILFIFSSSWLNRLGSHLIYIIGILIAVLTKLAMIWVRDYVGTLVIITIMGISRCVIMVLYPLVVADSVRPEQFPSAMGISMMIFGLISITMGPIIETIELLKENNQKYKRHPVVKKIVDQTDGRQAPDNTIDKDVAQKENVVLLFLRNVLDWRFLKKFFLSCTCLGMPLSLVSDVVFTLFLPQYLYSRDCKREDATWVIKLLSVGDIVTRVFLILLSKWLLNESKHLTYVIGMAIDVVSKFVLLTTSNNIISLTVTGCSHCIIMILFPLVVSDSAPPEDYSTGLGVCIMLYGLIGITLGPAIRAVRDATGEYRTMFHVLNGLMAAVTVAWSFELYYKRKNTRKHTHLDLRARVDDEE